MYRLIGLILVLSVPLAASAGDNSCLSQVKSHVANDAPEFSSAVIARVSGLADAKKSEISFSHQAGVSDFSLIRQLSYRFVVHTATAAAFFETQLQAPLATATDEAFAIEEKAIVFGADGSPIYFQDQRFAVDHQCGRHPLETHELEFMKQSGGFGVHSSTQQNGQVKASADFTWTTAQAAAWAQLDQDGAFAPFQAVQQAKYTEAADESGLVWKLETAPARAISRRNAITGAMQTIPGMALSMIRPESQVITYMYAPPGSPYYYQEVQSNGSVAQADEAITQTEWMREPLNDNNIGLYIQMHGFHDGDFARPLKYRLDLVNKAQWFDNWRVYFSSASGTGTSFTLVPGLGQQTALPLAAPVAEADQKYLQSSEYIQIEKVTDIVNALRPLTVGKTRLQVAGLVSDKVMQILVPDKNGQAAGINEVHSTEEILSERTGVCHHYAALFTAIARGLGLPSRIVGGLALAPNSADVQLHAWVEVKINNGTWWPIDPQMGGAQLTQSFYFPIALFKRYDRQANDPLSDEAYDQQTGMHFFQFKQARFTRLP